VSATRLLVLGVVRMHGTAHGYQVRRDLLTWSADKWANAAPGSIYHALKKMAAEKLLEIVESDGEARGPDRTAYRLTLDGETEFQLLLAKSLSEGENNTHGAYALSAAVTLLPALPRARAISLLRHRLTQLEGDMAAVTSVLTSGTDWGHPPHVDELYRLWQASIGSTADWIRQLIGRLEAGEYVMADDDSAAFGTPNSIS
jgi:DNA-binding PadR family transcriptional regulator